MEEYVAGVGLFPDDQARMIIETRRPIVQAHLARWQAASASLTTSPEAINQDWLIQFERSVCNVAASDFDERYQGRETWLNGFLLPLAHDLELVQVAETTTLNRLHRTGWFDTSDSQTGKLQRLPADQVIPAVHTLLHHVSYHKHRVAALVKQQYCRDKEAATRIVEAWRNCERQAGGLARGFMLAYLAHNDIGLLINSSYPYTDELLFLETQRPFIMELSSEVVLHQLQADIIALAQAWQSATPGFWCLRLLQEPPESEYRKRIGQNFGTRRRSAVVQMLVTRYNYVEPEAQALVDYTLHSGLRALVAYRNDSENVLFVGERYAHYQLRRILRETYSALTGDAQAALESLALNLQAAIRISKVQFPLFPLLTEYPSSQRRIKVSRRFRFGLAAIIKRRNQKRTRRKAVHQKTASKRSGRQPISVTSLVQTFAMLSNLEEGDAANRLRDLITYGGIGLLLRGQRLRCLDLRLLSWLRLIKYGRLDGRVPWPRLLMQLDSYRRSLNLSRPISSLLARALFHAIPRPAFWYGGQGEATVRLRQRGTLVVRSAPRLHERWVVIAIPSPVDLCDTFGHPLSDKSYLVLVIEANGLFPLAIWPSVTHPTAREVGLALYQAIWHPGVENWPVKGIPEQIVVCDELIAADRADLDRAADYLLCDLFVQPRRALLNPALRTLLQTFARGGIKTALMPLALDERTPTRVMRMLEQWINQQFFPYHRPAPVWQEIAKSGVVMPGHDTPAAGWLLPVAGEASVTAESVEYEGRHYRKPLEAAIWQERLPVRHPSLPTAEGGIFVETQSRGGIETIVQYVTERR